MGQTISNDLNVALSDTLRKAIAGDFTKVVTDLTEELESIIISTQGYPELSTEIIGLYESLVADTLTFCENGKIKNSRFCSKVGIKSRNNRPDNNIDFHENERGVVGSDSPDEALCLTIYSADASSEAAGTAVSNYLSKFNEIYRELSNVKFTIPVITASVTSGTAPLIVTFDGSASIDPANRSLDLSLIHI